LSDFTGQLRVTTTQLETKPCKSLTFSANVCSHLPQPLRAPHLSVGTERYQHAVGFRLLSCLQRLTTREGRKRTASARRRSQ